MAQPCCLAPEIVQNRQKLTEIEQVSSCLFTIAEFCAAVRISERQYFRLRAEGQGPKATYLGGRVLISRTAIDHWLWQHEEQ
jgi:predicted DNA-binding transcriptional regulator AlpA